ncbi:hypothetical protein M407DRAFT_31381 [Tulasnella calospora MUT 4182]|uniref:BAH domain-containing protein n=1 Tax=Tulasnella calospora MUT 4182 TaxID=1051891 RepID=A0A0C3Q5Q8_9AGAM|nr:hypothetical protein M407DRAFT_31381 [Tulasnella calospora MUT 4182]
MSSQLTPDELRANWPRLTVHCDSMDLTKRGLGVLCPGSCITVLPSSLDPEAACDADDLWYAVYLEGGADRKKKTYIKVAWFYTQDQVDEVLLPSNRRAQGILKEISKLPSDELILSTHWDVLETESISDTISISYNTSSDPDAVLRYSKLLVFGRQLALLDGSPETVQTYVGVTLGGSME